MQLLFFFSGKINTTLTLLYMYFWGATSPFLKHDRSVLHTYMGEEKLSPGNMGEGHLRMYCYKAIIIGEEIR